MNMAISNKPRPGLISKFSDLEAIALDLTAESMSIDSESYLFAGSRIREL